MEDSVIHVNSHPRWWEEQTNMESKHPPPRKTPFPSTIREFLLTRCTFCNPLHFQATSHSLHTNKRLSLLTQLSLPLTQPPILSAQFPTTHAAPLAVEPDIRRPPKDYTMSLACIIAPGTPPIGHKSIISVGFIC